MHWADGGAIELDAVSAALKTQGAKLLIDATHGAGVMPIDVRRIDPDFLVFPTYKWVLGPYDGVFLYVARRWQAGVPIEQASSGRRAINSERAPYLRDTAYVANAPRLGLMRISPHVYNDEADVGRFVATFRRLAALT